MENTTALPVALTIAGSDSGGGAGIQADLLTFAANGTFGTTAITCLTAQHPAGVSAVEAVPQYFLTAQLEQVAGYFELKAAKTGMLFNTSLVEATADFVAARPGLPVVVDPVMVASSGAILLQPEAIDAIKRLLLPKAALIAPNLDEVDVLLGRRPRTITEVELAARQLLHQFGVPVLLKGGHLVGPIVSDLLMLPGGDFRWFESPRIHGVNTHGSGCTLSAAIAAYLARGLPLAEAVEKGHAYLQKTLRQAMTVGQERFIAHLLQPAPAAPSLPFPPSPAAREAVTIRI